MRRRSVDAWGLEITVNSGLALAVMALLIVAIAATTGCSNKTEAEGTFAGYKWEGTGQSTQAPSGNAETDRLNETVQLNGQALVLLDNKNSISAKCPIDGLQVGQRVKVRQAPDGLWTVTEALPPK